MLTKNKITFLQNLKAKLKYFNYADNTIYIYMHYVNQFLDNIKVSPSKLNSDIFQSYLNNYEFSSRSQQSQIISALKFFYEKVLNKKYSKVNFKRPRKKKKLPRVIDVKLLAERIDAISNLKHKAILSLLFSTGLRRSEAINLKITDIDSKRNIIHIHQSKGRKDRTVNLSPQLLKILRAYYLKYKPIEYLFNGQNDVKYSASSIYKISKKYLNVHPHILRHSYATGLVELNVNLRVIQDVLGHKNIKTTEIYTHVSNQAKNQLPELLKIA